MKRKWMSLAICAAMAMTMVCAGPARSYAADLQTVEDSVTAEESAEESESDTTELTDVDVTDADQLESADLEQLVAPELEAEETIDPELQLVGSSTYNQRSNGTYGSVVDSYLEYDGSSLMKVQANSDASIEVTYYDTSYNQKSSRTIAAELPLFGGFYATESNYYIVSGQSNDAESASVECYRITKYDKNWNRLGSVGLRDCNTTLPFRAGSCRMTHSGNYLFVHTCHQMYTSGDGLRHQANLRIQVDTSTMTITDSYSSVMNISWGYCSHSFDQYVLIDNDHVVTLDHGDAYPRAAAVCVYKNNFSSGKFMSGWSPVNYYKALTIPGTTGANATGVSLGGFEMSDSSYLAAASSVSLNAASYNAGGVRNIVVSAVSRSDGSAKENWITNYSDASAVRPHLVNLGSNEYMLLWMRVNEDKVYYCKLDGSGNRITEIRSKDGILTSCKPVIVKGKLVWYQNDGSNVIFHQIGIPGYKDPQVSAFVTRLYQTCLGRTPDAGGLQHWHDLLWEGTSSGAQVAKGFVFSKEYLAKNTSNEEYVDMLYRVFMDREADAGGKAHWVGYLENGVSREFVFRGFAQSVEYTGICIDTE